MELGRLHAPLVGTLEGHHGHTIPAGAWCFGARPARIAYGEPLATAVLVRLTPRDHGVAYKAWYELIVRAEVWAMQTGLERTRRADLVMADAAGTVAIATIREEAAEVDRRVRAELRRVAAAARVPGFRPGRLPIGIAERSFGARVRAEVAFGIVLAKCAEQKLDGQEATIITGGRIVDGEPFVAGLVAPAAPAAPEGAR